MVDENGMKKTQIRDVDGSLQSVWNLDDESKSIRKMNDRLVEDASSVGINIEESLEQNQKIMSDETSTSVRPDTLSKYLLKYQVFQIIFL